jgi:tetratricopeptide (TPR) repeat protein
MPKAAVTQSVDPVLANFNKALEALHGKGWAKAAKLFESVIEETDTPELRERARQYLAACRLQEHKAKGEDGPSPDVDPYLRAVFEKNRGNYAAALDLVKKNGGEKDERFAYLAASIHAAEGHKDEAAKTLAHAVELNAKNRVHAFHDPDFAELRRDPEHRHLFDLS